MSGSRYVISCVIIDDKGRFLTEKGWARLAHTDVCLFTLIQAARKISELAREDKVIATFKCVLQNKSFDFYDGKSWVYDFADAKLYSHEQATALLRDLK
jgi:hypothetical protein